LIKKIENSGVEVYCDTCILVTWLKEAGVDSITTNSGKTAYYAPQFCKVDVVYDSLIEIVKKASV
jgi:predicted aconitase